MEQNQQPNLHPSLQKTFSKAEYKFYIQQLITFVMKNGKKNRAQKIVNQVFIELRKILKKELKGQERQISVEYVFMQALDNTRLLVSLKKIKYKRFIKYVPYYLMTSEKQLIAGLKMILNASKSQPHTKFAERIAAEIWFSFLSKSTAIKSRNEIHIEAYKNRLNAHYRWPTISKS